MNTNKTDNQCITRITEYETFLDNHNFISNGSGAKCIRCGLYISEKIAMEIALKQTTESELKGDYA